MTASSRGARKGSGRSRLKVYIVDNGGQWTHREYRVVRDLGAEAVIVPNDTPFQRLEDADALVLSGGTPRIGLDAERMGCNGEYLDMADVPVLGICAGHQFMAIHFGGAAREARKPEFGMAELLVDERDELFASLPSSFRVWESHNDEVVSLTKDFEVLAHSRDCRVQAFKYIKRPFYGVQFHPEVEHTEHGAEILGNFLALCRKPGR